MTLRLPNDVLISQVMQEMRRVNKAVRAFSNEEANKKRNIGSLSAEDIVIAGIDNNQYSTLDGVVGAISSGTSYLQLANSGLQEQQTLLQEAIALVNQYIGNIGVQTAASTAQLNAQLQVILGQIQTVVNAVQTVNGNDILGYVVAPFAQSTALQCVTQLGADAFTISLSIVDEIANISVSGSANVALRYALLPQINGSVTGNLYDITSVATQNTVNASLTSEFAILTNATNSTNTSPCTITDGLVAAMEIIPTIDLNATTYISQVISDCNRVETLCALLPEVMVAAGIIGVGGTAANVAPIKIIACMTNATGGVTSGNAMVGGITSNSTQYAPAANASYAAFAALLTPAEIAALKALVSNTGALNNNALVVGASVGTIKVDAVITMLQQITSFVNVGSGNNLLNVNSAYCAISNCSSGTSVAVGSGTSIGGTIGQWCGQGDGLGIGNGNCAVLAGVQDAGGANNSMNQVVQYLVNAVTSFVTSTNASITAQGPIPTIQIGLNSKDTVTLNVNNSSLSVLGLNLQNLYLSTSNAQATLTSLQNASQTIVSNTANINSQLLQLYARNDTIYTNLDSLENQIDNILDIDLVATASQMNNARTAVVAFGAILKLNATLTKTIADVTKRILVRKVG